MTGRRRLQRHRSVVCRAVPEKNGNSVFKTSSFVGWQGVWRGLSLFVAATLLLALWWGGAQPQAVGLVKAPWDKLLHLATYAVLAFSLGYGSGWRGLPLVLLAFLGAAGAGALDEWHQASLPGRQPGWADWVADVTGSMLGTSLAWWYRHIDRA